MSPVLTGWEEREEDRCHKKLAEAATLKFSETWKTINLEKRLHLYEFQSGPTHRHEGKARRSFHT